MRQTVENSYRGRRPGLWAVERSARICGCCVPIIDRPECSMQTHILSAYKACGFVRVACAFSFSLLLAEVPLNSQETKEVPLPELPSKAGKTDADAPKMFSTTPSGLKYRVLRKGSGPKPKATDRVKV